MLSCLIELMKSKYIKYIWILFFSLITFDVYSLDEFNFDVSEIQILENGNKFVGDKRGVITNNKGIEINADRFEYYKKSETLNAKGNVIIIDKINNLKIYSQNITYKKKNDLIFTSSGSRALDLNKGIEIKADSFEYFLKVNKIVAKKNASFRNDIKDYKISSDIITYFKNKQKISTKGKTYAQLNSKYNFETRDVVFLIDKMELISKNKTKINDKLNFYQLNKFHYFVDQEELKGEKILINTDYKSPTNDKYYFSSAIINLKDQSFVGKDTKIEIRKDIFDNLDNDPRIVGVSATGNQNQTKINKGVFTSCKKNENCTPWSISADEIIHDKSKKEMIYNRALLKIYDFPVLYFPKFFHPDPTVKRKSGFLQPKMNKSKILDTSINIPYYFMIDTNKDFTFNPTFSEIGTNFLQGEYRQKNINSSHIIDLGLTTNFKSNYTSKKKNIFHFFSKSEIDLEYDNFNESKLKLYVERTNKDTYLKIFDSQLLNNIVKPKDSNILTSGIDINLSNENILFETGLTSYEDLNKTQNDRYQYILPYYRFDSELFSNDLGRLNLVSNGTNILKNTNNLRTRVINNIILSSNEFVSYNTGLKSNLNLYLKNSNTIGKEDQVYKSSPQSELMNIFEINTSYPTVREVNNNIEILSPKISFRFNPGDMKNHADTDRTINVNNIFSIDRLGLEDSFESGKSLTAGLNYSKVNNENNNQFSAKIATVFRDKNENTIPQKTTLNEKNSHIFGGINYANDSFLKVDYNFASKDSFEKFKYHNVGANFSLNNFITEFNFIEENDVLGTSHIIENNSTFKFNDNNFLSFKTRRNKEIDLTEYYDLIYEYKNDCLTAGLKFQKTYYKDRDLEPSENLFFNIRLIPLTSWEQDID